MTAKTVKKIKAFNIKVDENLLKSFQAACSENDETASQVLRAAMREYLKKHKQAQLKL